MQPVERYGFHIEIRRSLPHCRCIAGHFIKIIYRSVAFKPCDPTSHSYIYRRSRAGTVAVTVLDKAGLQGPETGNRELVLGMGAKQGLEEGNGEPVLEMGAKQGLETGDDANFQGKGRFFGCRDGF